MANLQERRDKEGKLISYSIRVFRGRDPSTGKQLTPYSATWRVPEGWGEKRARKEAERQAVLFEKRCKEGQVADIRRLRRIRAGLEAEHGPQAPDRAPLPPVPPAGAAPAGAHAHRGHPPPAPE